MCIVDYRSITMAISPIQIAKKLISYDWETRPYMDMDWILRSARTLYYIYFNELEDFQPNDTKHMREHIVVGFVDFNPEKNCINYIEILPEYRRKGYASCILDKIICRFPNINRIYCDEDALPFWKSLYDGKYDSKNEVFTMA